MERNNGLTMKYFVLKPKGNNAYAKASREAMLVYAKCIETENPILADDIRTWIRLLPIPD